MLNGLETMVDKEEGRVPEADLRHHHRVLASPILCLHQAGRVPNIIDPFNAMAP